MSADEEESSAALPKTLVLSYVTNARSRTRVRRVAGVGVLMSGILGICLGVAGGICTYQLWDDLTQIAWYVTHGHFDYIPYKLIYRPMLWATPLLPAFFLPGLVQLSLANLAVRGNRFSCWFVLWCMVPSLVGLTAACVVIGGWSILDSFTGAAPDLRALLWFLWLVPLILLLLLLKDLATFVHWISRNPGEEKPKAKFFRGIAKKQ